MKIIARAMRYVWIAGVLAGLGGMLWFTPQAKSQNASYDLYYFHGQYHPVTNPCKFNFMPVNVGGFMPQWPSAIDWEYRLATCVLNRDNDPTNDNRVIATITDDPAHKGCESFFGAAYRDLPSNSFNNYTDHIGKNHVITCMRSDFPFPPNIPPAVASAGNTDWQIIPAGKCPNGSQNNPAFSFFGELIGLNYVATCGYSGQWLGELTLSCRGRPNPALRRGAARMRWTATADGGTGSYNFEWREFTGDPNSTSPVPLGECPARSDCVDATYRTLGEKTARVRVASGPARIETTCRINVLDFDVRER